MGVSVQEKIRAPGTRRRDVDEAEGFPSPLEQQPRWQIQAPVVVAQHAIEGSPRRLDRTEGRQVAKIAQMPDLVGLVKFTRDGFGKFSMGVGKDGDAQESFQWFRFQFSVTFCRRLMSRFGTALLNTKN